MDISFTYIDQPEDQPLALDLEDLTHLVNGSLIFSVSVADDVLDLKLAGGVSLKIAVDKTVEVIRTLDENESTSVRIKLVHGGHTPTAKLVEKRVHSLRQLYAMNFLIDAGLDDNISQQFRFERGDLEDLLDEEDRLYVEAASAGSLWLTVTTKTAAGLQALRGILPLFFYEGRTAVIARARAKTELAELDVEKKRLEIDLSRANGVVGLYNKIDNIKDEYYKERIKAELFEILKSNGTAFLSPPRSDTD